MRPSISKCKANLSNLPSMHHLRVGADPLLLTTAIPAPSGEAGQQQAPIC